MNEFEKKYRMFEIDDEKNKSFKNYSIGIEGKIKPLTSFVVTTLLIEKNKSPSIVMERDDAKLV